jgi:phosphoglycolate phosphatase
MRILFDLDGTLADSRHGITSCLQHALADAGVAVPPPDELLPYVGPPLAASFATLLGTSDPERRERAVTVYRQRYEKTGIVQHVLYPGAVDMLSRLRHDGHWMGIVTAKPHVYATRIIAHLGLEALVPAVLGPDLSARRYTKEDLIRRACDEWAIAAGDVLVGDRHDDILGAKANSLHAIAVTWGYGTRAELQAARPDSFADDPAAVVEIVRAIRERPNQGGSPRDRHRPLSRSVTEL